MDSVRTLAHALEAHTTWKGTFAAYLIWAGIAGAHFFAKGLSKDREISKNRPDSKTTALLAYLTGITVIVATSAWLGSNSPIRFWICLLTLLPPTLIGIGQGRSDLVSDVRYLQTLRNWQKGEQEEKEWRAQHKEWIEPPNPIAQLNRAKALYRVGQQQFFAGDSRAVYSYRDALRILLDDGDAN